MATTFTTNPFKLEDLLIKCRDGRIQLPEFQRSWVWDEDRIVSLIASISRGFPIGTLMTLATRADGRSDFGARAIEGADDTAKDPPDELLLDGQQRMTSLFQTCLRQETVKTITAKKKIVERWFYLDVRAALQHDVDREEAIRAVPADKKVKEDFNRRIVLDLSTPEQEYAELMFPLNRVFDREDWQEGFTDYCIARGDDERRKLFQTFRKEVLKNFDDYQMPVISLDSQTSHEAVCVVFEKVNTGGKALDAFELLTAMYSAQGYRSLRDDWLGPTDQSGVTTTPGIHGRLTEYGRPPDIKVGVLAHVSSTDFLQAISLLHTKGEREARASDGVPESDLPAIRASRQSLLDLPLGGYLRNRDAVEAGFKQAAKFLRQQCVYRAIDLPYQTQLVPLAAILATLGVDAEHAGHQAKLARWFWCGIFGELYGSAGESRFAKDIVEVPAWLAGGPEPTTVREGVFRAGRLYSMWTRQSAAYKGIHALLMREGAKDFRTGQPYDMAVFFDEDVDIHHIFPQKWCQDHKKDKKIWDSVINKTPLGYRTNRAIGGAAPSAYLQKLEDGRRATDGRVLEPGIDRHDLNTFVASHCIDVRCLRSDDFEAFIESRRVALLQLISHATGNTVSGAPMTADDGIDLDEQLARDSDNEAVA
ncbi:MAG TPA: DUF262 domain-containing protein [Vicinamibacterales bacterium]|jgi:hypothetical protein|nr:DUF262 domain-containing protein [Vicinamibacterales bacterium]